MGGIAILEDNEERVATMTKCLEQAGITAVVFFDNSPEMIEWLKSNLVTLSLISLDNDLSPERFRRNDLGDPGSGRDVTDFLATKTPCCPVIIHTSNYIAAGSMKVTLDETGWRYERVVPFNDLEWIEKVWIKEVLRQL